MAQPTYDWMNGGLTADHDPTANEPWDQGIIQYGALWRNSINNTIWFCTAAPNIIYEDPNINTDLEWMYIATLYSSATSASERSLRDSPDFSTSYMPSATNNTEINITLNFTSVLAVNSQVDIQTSLDDSAWTTLFPFVIPVAALANFNYPITFTLPAGSYYRIVQQTGTASSIVSIYEMNV